MPPSINDKLILNNSKTTTTMTAADDDDDDTSLANALGQALNLGLWQQSGSTDNDNHGVSSNNNNGGVHGMGSSEVNSGSSSSQRKGIDLFLSPSPSQSLGSHLMQLQHQQHPSFQRQSSYPNDSSGMSNSYASLTGTSSSTSESPPLSTHGGPDSSRWVNPQQQYGQYVSVDHESKRDDSIPKAGNTHSYPTLYSQSNAPAPGYFPSEQPMNGGVERGQFPGSGTRYGSHVSLNDSQPREEYSYGNNTSFMNESVNKNTVPTANHGGMFYMAVQSSHGGQVLQPVQMVQLPNGQSTILIPSQSQQQINGNPQFVDGFSHQSVNINSMSMPNLQVAYNANGQFVRQQMNGSYIPNGQIPQQSKKKDRRNKTRSKDLSSTSLNSMAGLGESLESYDGTTTPPEAITALYQSARRPALSELLGHVKRLSKDQVGCRLLQQSLDEDGPEAATEILREGLPFLAEAMTDPFGNYLFQKILEKVNDEERLRLISTVSPRLVNASLNLHGTRSVQKVVEVAANEKEAAKIVAKALEPAVARLCIDSHGNHVVQRVLQRLPHEHSKFVFEAVAVAVGDVARHRHGCCVIQRCLDSPQSPARMNLVQKIVESALELMQDAYGNYVVQYVLDVCGEDEAASVCESVVGKVSLLAIQKFSSNVMEKCLERSNDRVRDLYLQEISHPEKVRELMSDPFGNYVIQRGLAVASQSQALRLVDAMRPHLPGMRNTAGGRRIIAKITRRFPDFTIDPPQVSPAGHTFVTNMPTMTAVPIHDNGGMLGGAGNLAVPAHFVPASIQNDMHFDWVGHNQGYYDYDPQRRM